MPPVCQYTLYYSLRNNRPHHCFYVAYLQRRGHMIICSGTVCLAGGEHQFTMLPIGSPGSPLLCEKLFPYTVRIS